MYIFNAAISRIRKNGFNTNVSLFVLKSKEQNQK